MLPCAAVPDARAVIIARLLAEAEALEAQAEQARREGHPRRAADLLEASLVASETARLLQERGQSVTVPGMVSARRAHISAGRSKQERGGKIHPLVAAASAKGHTLRSLAAAVDTPVSIISRALGGTRRIRRSAAEAIAKLTGYAATDKNWPGGWASEE